MLRILKKRIPFYLFTAWAAVTMNFIIPRLMPGNPADLLVARLQQAGQVSPVDLQAIKAEFGGNDHAGLLQQYGTYLHQVVLLHFGVSTTYFPEPVTKVISGAIPWTLLLVTGGTVLSYAIGIVAGIVLAWRRGSRWDNVAVPSGTFFSAVPFFWVALLLVWILGVTLGWFPINGAWGPNATVGVNGAFIKSWLGHAILPIVTIVASSFIGHMLHMRNMMVTTIGDDYVLMAEAKGLTQRRIKYAYAARNAMLPSIASFTIALGFIVSGSVLVETVFSYPGVGYVLFQAVQNEDYGLMQGIFLIIAVTVLVANLCADLAYAAFDPRARQQQMA